MVHRRDRVPECCSLEQMGVYAYPSYMCNISFATVQQQRREFLS